MVEGGAETYDERTQKGKRKKIVKTVRSIEPSNKDL